MNNEHRVHYGECDAEDIVVHALLGGLRLILERTQPEGEIAWSKRVLSINYFNNSLTSVICRDLH